MYMSASDVIYIPDPRKDFVARDKLENSFVTNSKYLDYVNTLPEKDRSKIKDLALYESYGKKPRVFTSICSGVIAIPVDV